MATAPILPVSVVLDAGCTVTAVQSQYTVTNSPGGDDCIVLPSTGAGFWTQINVPADYAGNGVVEVYAIAKAALETKSWA